MTKLQRRCTASAGWLLATALLLPSMAAAVEVGLDDHRTRIAAERSAVEAAWADRQRECAMRFAVTACAEDAQRRRRAALAELRRQERLLDEAQRRERATARLEHLDTKALQRPVPVPRARESQAPSVPIAPRQPPELRVARTAPPASVPEHPVPPAPRADAAPRAAAASQVDRRPQETARAAAFAARVEEAHARRAAAERRDAERAEKAKPRRPLPLPEGAPAP